MRDGESLNQKKPWPLSSALRPFCSAKPAVVGRYLQIVKAASKQAGSNLSHAENSGEGSEAIRCCKDYLKGQLPYLWKLPLAYDIQYLKQRKRLLQYLLELMETYEIEKKGTLQRVGEIAQIQQNLLDQIYIRTLQGEIDQEKFEWLGEWEARLAGTILQDHRRA